MNCIWIIVLLFCVGNQGRGTSECGCQIEPRDNCNREIRCSDGRVDDNRRSAFDDWEDNTCPCRREMDYYQAEIKEEEEKSDR